MNTRQCVYKSSIAPRQVDHTNPIDKCEITDYERSLLFREWAEIVGNEFGTDIRVIPLLEDKTLALKGRASLDNPRNLDLSLEKAEEWIRTYGVPGFVIYAGREKLNTENLVLCDHDNLEEYPAPTGEPTLEVLSGSGRGVHEYYRNDGSIEKGAQPSGLGELKVRLYCITPGSIHPSGGVYHISEDRPVAKLSHDQLPDFLKPTDYSEPKKPIKYDSEKDTTGVENKYGEPLQEFASRDEELEKLITHLQHPDWDRDTSKGDWILAKKLSYYQFERSDAINIICDRRSRRKTRERIDDYVEPTVRKAYSRTKRTYNSGKKLPEDKVDPIDWELLTSPDQLRKKVDELGVKFHTKEQYQQALGNILDDSLRDGKYILLDLPTCIGKSHEPSTRKWKEYSECTGDQPVVMLHDNTEARAEAVARSKDYGLDCFELLERSKISEVAAGDYDPGNAEDAGDGIPITMDGTPASDWIDKQCDEKGESFSIVYNRLCEHNDQGEELPPVQDQWKDIPRGRDGNPKYDIIHATKPFAYVEAIRADTNIILDEETPFTVDTFNREPERIKKAIEWHLRAVDAPVTSFVDFISASKKEFDGDLQSYLEFQAIMNTDPDPDKFFGSDNAHTLAPAITRCIWLALKDGKDQNERYSATIETTIPSFVNWNQSKGSSYVSIVMSDTYEVLQVRHVPDFSKARSVICLEANPTVPNWKLNTQLDLEVLKPDTDEERRRWRIFDRNLIVVQVGDNRRPVGGNGCWYKQNKDRTKALFDGIENFMGQSLTAVIAPSSIEDDIKEEFGYDNLQTMHQGGCESRNDFAGISVGLVHYSLDPGDNPILDTIAELGLDARPVYLNQDIDCESCDNKGCSTCQHEQCSGDGCFECQNTGWQRAKGRAFTGEDADIAEDLLNAVAQRQNEQAIGRYARRPEGGAIVFTDSNVAKTVDIQLEGTEVFGPKTYRSLEVLEQGPTHTSGLVGSNQHIRAKLSEIDVVNKVKAGGEFVWRLQPDHAPKGQLHGQRGIVHTPELTELM